MFLLLFLIFKPLKVLLIFENCKGLRLKFYKVYKLKAILPISALSSLNPLLESYVF
jgi:hypothetical protein